MSSLTFCTRSESYITAEMVCNCGATVSEPMVGSTIDGRTPPGWFIFLDRSVYCPTCGIAKDFIINKLKAEVESWPLLR